ncbi:MAG: hypothetical protein IT361_19115 [Gemmatimonadaceae bacterium]|nr:hypothetical protein [Gemmatimonadaceae bacterium]
MFRLLASLVVLTVAAPSLVYAQGGRLVWRGLFGDVAFEVRTSGTDVLLGASGDSGSASAAFRGTDVRRFVDSLTRRLTSTRARRDTTWTLRVEEPGTSAGAMSLSPAGRGADRQRVYRLFMADDVVSGVRATLTTTEVRVLLRSLREASAVPKKPPAVRRRRSSR